MNEGENISLEELDYELPEALIAQRPSEKRDECRLLVYNRTDGEISHHI
ncbi:MAG TPA: tRNA preQ1(34) S-adenosylmethionine ribosyltransferase-isomerase QueA, partial [Firmicutes bacterium]|nr:tRNA preQ1(34) S-adenosylmethionine ribosyltransferase-isomerase QueA [Bacillota bacterium]